MKDATIFAVAVLALWLILMVTVALLALDFTYRG